jgi:serine/threonine protein kinase/tetratricopeptide (TPR) repeat protein
MTSWPRVKELFHAALEREPSERASFLDERCKDDDAVRAEVQRLLSAHEHAGGFIEQSPVATPPRVIGHYAIERLIGVGGMGEVYCARDRELGRTVAIKIALENDADAAARLRREAQHASQLNHPNISHIYEVGTADGRPFIAMELVDGRRLCDAIPAGGLPTADVVSYGVQIADALAHAHAGGVIHRDLKSANVMVTRDGRVKVLDFGLARRHSEGHLRNLSQSKSKLSEEGVAAGTLPYMTPEAFRGGDIDATSDVWALGVVLYEMASGRLPFAGTTGFELIGAILHEPPASLPAHVPVALRDIILKCLAKDPRERVQDAGEVRAALQTRVLHTRAVRKSRVMAAALAAALLVSLIAVPLWRHTRTPSTSASTIEIARPRVIAVKPFENVSGNRDLAWLSQGLPRMVTTGLAQIRGLQVVSAQYLDEAGKSLGNTPLDRLSSTEFAEVARRSGAAAVVSGTVMRAGEEIRVDIELHDLSSGRVLAAESGRGTDVFAIADHLVARIRTAVGFDDAAGVRRVADVSSSSLEAYRLYSEGVEAVRNARAPDAVRLLEAAVATDPLFGEAYMQLGVAESSRGQFLRRREYLLEAAKHADRLSDRQRRLLEFQLARGTASDAELSRLLDDLMAAYPDVEEIYGAAKGIYSPGFGGLHDPEKLLSIARTGVKVLPASGPAHNSLGYALLGAGRYADALHEFEQYARLAPREPNPHDSMGEAYLFMGLPEKAAERYAQTRAIDAGFDAGRTGEALALGTLGRYDEAISVNPTQTALKALLLSRVGRYREASQILVTGTSSAVAMTATTAYLLASIVALERNDAAEALRMTASVRRAIARASQPRVRMSNVVAHVLSGLASLRSGNTADARAWLAGAQTIHNPAAESEAWWCKALEAEIALSHGEVDRAAALFGANEPTRKWFANDPLGIAVVANHLPFRDGAIRAAKAGGNLTAAIAGYRALTTFGPESKWISVLEPRYVLELARLLEKSGDRASALSAYQRFLDLWKRADPGLPELDEARRAVRRLQAVRTN